MSPVYSRPYPAYYWAPANVEAQPIWEDPYCYREPRPEEWTYGKCEGPYWYYPRTEKDGYYSYWPRHGDWDPRFYERNPKEFGGDFTRGLGRNLRPANVYPPPPATSGPIAFRSFHPGDQFRHPDEYPMRFVPVAYGPASEPWEKAQVKPHCCGCRNHVCEPQTRAIKGDERKELMDGITEDDEKTKTQNLKEFPGPVVCFNPLEWHGKAPYNRIRNEGKAEHPVYWVPMNWNRNEGDKEQERRVSGNWIPLDMNSRPLRWEESKNKPPAYWIPFDPSHGPQALEEYKKKSQLEGNENKFPGYWIPLDSIARLQGDQKEKENSFSEGKFRPLPVLWIPEENLKMGDSQEGIPNGNFERRPALVQKFSDEDEKQRVTDVRKEKKARDVHVEETGEDYLNIANAKQMTKNGGLEKADRPVLVQEIGKMNEKQRSEEGRKEAKRKDIPVKQVEEEKFAAEQKTKENVTKVKTRDIPVKQLGGGKSEEVQKAKENALEIKARSLPVKQPEKEMSTQAQVQKSGEKAAENHKASSPRASKLPPVCLRVDPLPGKKKTNGKSSSRSPSPPHKNNDLASNASLQSSKPDDSKIPVELTKAEENASLKASKHAGEAKEIGNTESLQASKVSDETKKMEENASLKASKHAGETKEIEDPADLKASQPGDETKLAGENESEKSLVQDSELKKLHQDLNAQAKGVGSKKSELSRDQAALRIQAMYGGWQVRKLQPLRKLREIAKIRHRMEELKQQIMSPEFQGELERDDKTKVKMGETLMGLLLQLDTVQVLHPVVRDVRKSLARELVRLQEKLDKLVEEAHSSHLQQCMMHERENETGALLQKTDDSDKGLDATEGSSNTLVGNSSENQEVENEITKGGNAEEREAVKHESFEIENAISNDGKGNVLALEKAENKDEIDNAITNDRKAAEDNVPVENAIVSDNREVNEIDLQNKETENQSEDISNEKKSLVASDDVILSVNEAVTPLQNTAIENDDKSEPTLEISSEEEEKSLEPNNLKKQDSALSPVADNEICPLSVVAQEQEAEVSDSSIPLDAKANEKTATLEKEERLKVIGLEEDNSNSLPKNDFVDREENYETSDLKKPISTLPLVEISKSSTQIQNLEENVSLEGKAEMTEAPLENFSVVQKSEPSNLKEPGAALTLAEEKEMCPVNSRVLDENSSVSDKDTSLDQDGEVTPIEMKAEPENLINAGKVEVCGLPLDKCESKELEDALPEKTAGDSNVEFIAETSSHPVSDTHSVSHSDGDDETDLNKMEKVLNVAENMSGKGGLAAFMAEGSYNSAIEKGPKALITGDDFSGMNNVKNDLHLQSEEHVSKCSRATHDVSPHFVGTLGTGNSVNENDLAHSENIHYAERNISKSERSQDHHKWEEENEKLKEMVEKLVEAEKMQMSTIALLNDKIKQLEGKLGKGKNTRKVRAGQMRLRNNRVGRNTKNASIQQC